MNLKLAAATGLYRWNLSSSIVSVVFSALAFIGVFAVLFALPWYALLIVVIAVIFGTGFVLDRVVKFWSAQATVGTVRNQYLVNVLYQKEWLLLQTIYLPMLRSLLSLLKERGDDPAQEREIADSITRIEATVANKEWAIRPEEKVY